MKKIFRWMMVIALLMAFAPAPALAKKILRFPLRGNPAVWPVSQPSLINTLMIQKVMFNGLVKYSKKDGVTVVPDLAVSWTHSPDVKVWTFKLRKGVRWHDGKPFTAADVEFNYKVHKVKKYRSRFHRQMKSLEKFEVLDSHTVRLTFNQPMAALTVQMGYNIPVFPKHLLEGKDLKYPGPATQKFLEHPIGTGPYKFKEFKRGSYFLVERNDDYWGGKPKIDEVYFKIMPDVTAQVAQMKANELDVIWEVEPSLIEAVRGIPSAVIHKKDAPYYNWFLLNQKHPLFKDRRVRQAIAMAFDKETIANKILKGMVTPASGPVQPAIKWAYPKDVKGLPYDPARAKKLLAEAGWKPGPGGILQNSKGEKFTFEISGDKGNPTRELMFQVSRQMLGKIGIDATVKLYEFNALMKIYRGGRYASRFAYWITPPDPDVTDYFGTGGGRNFIKYSNPEVDKLLKKGVSTTDRKKRAAVYKVVQKLLAEDVPGVYVYYKPEYIAVHKRISGYPKIGIRDWLLYVNEMDIK
ncbi:MAG: ABC transporter substrate-binding protein [Nitrospinota bacterium]|nr:ABC transporter substrate-binding protein [Nitrospinota bacterium]